MIAVSTRLSLFFPLILVCSVGLAFLFPPLFGWVTSELISKMLGVIMLSMGMTLETEDFRRVFKNPVPIFMGVFLQYSIMPLSGYLIAKFLGLEPAMASGLILVASCPGGTASNLMTYIAKADVALSVTLTVVSTFLGIILTPLLANLLIGSRIEFNGVGLFETTLQVIVFPVVLGMVLSGFRTADLHWFPLGHRFLLVLKRLITYFRDFAPVTSIVLITVIVSSILSSSRERIFLSPLHLMGSVFLLHSMGFLFGYIIIKIYTKNVVQSRTISIEVGMQNSGLGVVLANSNFSDPFVAVPAAVSSLFHSLIASFLASIWSRKDLRESVKAIEND